MNLKKDNQASKSDELNHIVCCFQARICFKKNKKEIYNVKSSTVFRQTITEHLICRKCLISI